jgi:hypothetical protein
MTTAKQIEIAQAIIATGLVNKVFHSCQILRDDNQQLYPVYQSGKDWTYAGIDDAKGLFAYIRSNGDIVSVPFKMQSCARSYDVTAPLRVVFFSDNEDRNQEELLSKLTSFAFMTGLNLVRIVTDKFRLVKEESPVFRARFDGKTFYAAFDVTANFILLPSTCETDMCETHPNPITSCPAAAPISSSSATS